MTAEPEDGGFDWYEDANSGGDAERPIYPSPSAPLDVARRIYSEFTANGLRTLICWRAGFMEWHRTHWSEMDTAELRSRIYDILGGVDYEQETKNGIEVKPWNPDKRKVANVMEAMAAIGHVSSDVDPSAWVDVHSAAETSAAQMVSCRNGILDLSSRQLIDHTPALFNVVSVPFDYQPVAPDPVAWLEFLSSLWPDDPDSIALLQEFVGYVLSGRTDMQKLLLLIGPTRSGKGTIARMLTELIGRGHVAGPTLASLGTNFGLSPLLGKPLAIISDARLGNTPSHTVVERLLSITGEDMLTVDRKFREPWSGKLPARFVVLSNELPRFRDSSGAIANRLLILQMQNSFLGREDRTLDDRLRGELPGILKWALNGLDRLVRNGRFTVPQSSEDSAGLMMDLASPVSAFVRECCTRGGTDLVTPRDDLYSAWKVWADDNGHHAGAKSTFGRDLRAVVPELRDVQLRVDGQRVRAYARIGLPSSTLNGIHPVPPVPPSESAGHGAAGGTGDPVPDPVPGGADAWSAKGGTGTPVPDAPANPQVNEGGTGGTGKSPFKVQHPATQPGPATEAQHDAYRRGLCVDCEARSPSAGRPRCDACHSKHARAMSGYDR
jgi:putative DNA primase/helicase